MRFSLVEAAILEKLVDRADDALSSVETAATAVGVLRRAVGWFAARGVAIERVLNDSGSAYRSHAWRDTCIELGVTPERTRPYRPQTDGKLERFPAPWPRVGPSAACS
jgi:transposase InsO family protein